MYAQFAASLFYYCADVTPFRVDVYLLFLAVAYGDKDSNRLPVGLLAHHSQSALVLNGTAGQLQFYNPFADKPFFDVSLVTFFILTLMSV